MWREYFGPKARIFGVDINPLCKQFEEEGIEIFIGDQEDRNFLKSLQKMIPRIDILIDDGGHTMKQQINTFEELFARIDTDGVYLCEDLHTSYWRNFGGGYKRKGSFIEYSKNFIDYINAWHSVQRSLQINELTKSIHSLHYYDSVLAIEKRKIDKPFHLRIGTSTFPDYEPRRSLVQKLKLWLQRRLNRHENAE
jgi:hypothetical protein